MTVHFIGAGPGSPDLITIRGAKLIADCKSVLYAGSLVPEGVLEHAGDGAEIIDTAPLNLDEIIALIEAAHAKGWDVARVHSGDPSLYGAISEQIRRLEALDIPFTITPGVPEAFTRDTHSSLRQRLPCCRWLSSDVARSGVYSRYLV